MGRRSCSVSHDIVGRTVMDAKAVRKRTVPTARVRKIFEEVTSLPRSQQQRVVAFVEGFNLLGSC